MGGDPHARLDGETVRVRVGGCEDGCSPDQVCETSVQVHGGGGAAEHGQDALGVQEL